MKTTFNNRAPTVVLWTLAHNPLNNYSRAKCHKKSTNYFFNADMPVLEFFEYLIWFAKNWHIANFANFVFRHKQQAKVNLEQNASKSPPNIFSTPICQFWNFLNISSGSRNIGTLRNQVQNSSNVHANFDKMIICWIITNIIS